MKALLVLSQSPEFAEAIRAAANPEKYRVVHCINPEEAEPLLQRGILHACVVDVEGMEVQGIWMIEKVRRQIPHCPMLVYTGLKSWGWEEEAYLKGAAHVVGKPVRSKLFNELLERSFNVQITPPAPISPLPRTEPLPASALSNVSVAAPNQSALQALEVVRHFSAILMHSLSAEPLLNKFLLLLREILGVNRAAIFLRQPVAVFGDKTTGEETRRLRKSCAIGLPANLLEHFGLSLNTGIGQHLLRSGRILRRHSEEARADSIVQQEFELLGTQVAIPILDRETLIGVAVFDGRVTGDLLSNPELELIFHLLEEVSLAIKNIWLHDQLAANHEMMTDTFRQLSSGCVLVGQDLTILHANKAARSFFSRAGSRAAELEFTDLPMELGNKVYQVLRTGTSMAPFRYQPDDSSKSVFNISIVPFQKPGSPLPASALLMAEDLTQSEQLRKLELEAANLRLVTTMADRLAHEIGNALVPLSTHQQLLKEKYKDPEFRASLELAMADGIKRVSRLINQMRFLARDNAISVEAFPVENLIEDAYQEAQKHQSAKAPKLEYKNGVRPVILTGDRGALKHALSEIMLNALQANPSDPKIGVRVHSHAGDKGNGSQRHDVEIEIQDNGEGFTPETGQKALTPFFTTRNVGLGLGLAVSRKIIETHHGKLEIVDAKGGHSGLIRITLPLAPEEPA